MKDQLSRELIADSKPKRTKISPKVNQRAFELCPDEFTTMDFADRAGTGLVPARKYLLRATIMKKVAEGQRDCWIKLNGTTPTRTLLEDEVKLITEAMDLIKRLIDENRWLKAEVEKWAGLAKQAKIYFQREE